MSQCVKVQLQGVPAYGVIDSGADITILGGDLFRKVATVAWLKKRDLKKPDKTPKTYNQKPFILDGRMNLDVAFTGKTMHTPVYLKTDVHVQLLLSEGCASSYRNHPVPQECQEMEGRPETGLWSSPGST